jgi:hypothetical protein
MLTLLRSLRLLSLALWVGGIVFFINVAQIAFSNLPTTHLAGIIVRGSQIRLHLIGILASCVYLVATAILVKLARGNKPLQKNYAISILLLLVMEAGTLYSKEHVIPQMERDRQSALQTVPEIDSLPATNSIRMDFERLHQQSTTVESVVLLCGVGMIVLLAREPQLTAQR